MSATFTLCHLSKFSELGISKDSTNSQEVFAKWRVNEHFLEAQTSELDLVPSAACCQKRPTQKWYYAEKWPLFARCKTFAGKLPFCISGDYEGVPWNIRTGKCLTSERTHLLVRRLLGLISQHDLRSYIFIIGSRTVSTAKNTKETET